MVQCPDPKLSSIHRSLRLRSVDQVRALAIISMMIAHFGPGVIARVPYLTALNDEILFLGKFATVMFVAVFGIIVGFVYYPEFNHNRRKCIFRVTNRTGVLLIASIVICIPNYILLDLDSNNLAISWLFATYSVMNFYVMALASTILWLYLLDEHPTRNAMVLGLGYWAIGDLLLIIWPSDQRQSVIEFLRINLIAGPYSYFQLAGWTLLATPIGIALRRAGRDGQYKSLFLRLMIAGVILAVGGWVLGTTTGEFNVENIVSGALKSPPRLWYWMMFSGPALLTLLGLTVLELNSTTARKVLYPLSLFGQGALPIYTGHAFVLPGLFLLDSLVNLEGPLRILLPFIAFGLFSFVVMLRYHLKASRKIRQEQPTIPASAAA